MGGIKTNLQIGRGDRIHSLKTITSCSVKMGRLSFFFRNLQYVSCEDKSYLGGGGGESEQTANSQYSAMVRVMDQEQGDQSSNSKLTMRLNE